MTEILDAYTRSTGSLSKCGLVTDLPLSVDDCILRVGIHLVESVGLLSLPYY